MQKYRKCERKFLCLISTKMHEFIYNRCIFPYVISMGTKPKKIGRGRGTGLLCASHFREVQESSCWTVVYTEETSTVAHTQNPSLPHIPHQLQSHIGTEYTEYQAFCPFVGIGSIHPPTPQACVAPPFGSKEGDTLACGLAHWYSVYTLIPLRT